jgi:hypothetical protein
MKRMQGVVVLNVRKREKMLNKDLREPLVARRGIVLIHKRTQELAALGKEFVVRRHGAGIQRVTEMIRLRHTSIF